MKCRHRKYRKLKYNGQRVANSPTSVQMTIDSFCPQKWAFVDMETGQIWVHCSRSRKNAKSNLAFFPADPDAMRAMDNIMSEIKVREMGL
jgi:hypothetical protein